MEENTRWLWGEVSRRFQMLTNGKWRWFCLVDSSFTAKLSRSVGTNCYQCYIRLNTNRAAPSLESHQNVGRPFEFWVDAPTVWSEHSAITRVPAINGHWWSLPWENLEGQVLLLVLSSLGVLEGTGKSHIGTCFILFKLELNHHSNRRLVCIEGNSHSLENAFAIAGVASCRCTDDGAEMSSIKAKSDIHLMKTKSNPCDQC